MKGHLFVILGDMTTLDSDAVVVPCDEAVNVNAVWRPLLPSDQVAPASNGWIRLTSTVLEHGHHAALGDVKGRHVQLVATAAETAALSVEELTQRVTVAVRRAAQSASRHRGRHLPLVAVPLVGTGAGGLHRRRSEVVRHVVQGLHELADQEAVDVVLVLKDRRDYAAVQAARAALENHDDVAPGWRDLSPSQIHEADALGQRAARGELSLFVGSGVSVPLGLPSWHQLLQTMALEVRPDYEVPKDADLLNEAAGLKWLMGPQYTPFMKRHFDLRSHALGHALLAGLNVRQMVTTNYDTCLELALEGAGTRPFEVLTRSHATGGRPWLLKLHGDIRDPESLVLTKAEYQRLSEEAGALHGVVESLMLTSHLLFVGYSLTDHDFADVATGVMRVRDRAVGVEASKRRPAGTALALLPDAVDAEQWRGEVDVICMAENGTAAPAARLLEIFLDRVAWAALQNGQLAAEHLMDERYAAGASTTDAALRESLHAFLRHLPTEARSSAGWGKTRDFILSLGADDASVDRHESEQKANTERNGLEAEIRHQPG